MFNIYKIIFSTTLFMGTMISISSYSWLGTWMGLEINLLSFIPILNMKNNQLSSESSIKYFLIQALASSIFLFIILLMMMTKNMNSNSMFINKIMIMMISSSLLLKMGAAPFHFWFPEIIEGMNWINSLILLTWQKITPMMILSYTMKFSNYIIFIILISTFIGSIGGLNQISLRKILAYSSINHIGWMIASFLNNEMMWIMYFSIYSFMSITLILMFNKFNIYFLKQMYIMMTNNKMIKFMLLINLISLGGLPPFLGFLPKWLIIQNLNNFFFTIIFMILMSLITLYFYLRISYSSMMISNNELNFNLIYKINNKSNINFILLTIINIIGLIIYTLTFNFY